MTKEASAFYDLVMVESPGVEKFSINMRKRNFLFQQLDGQIPWFSLNSDSHAN